MDENGMRLDAILDELVGEEAIRAASHARTAVLLVEATSLRLAESRADAQGLAMRSLTAEISCATRLSEGTITRMLNDSETIVGTLPATLEALSASTISYRHAQLMAAAASALPRDSRGSFERALLPVAATTTAARFERSARSERERLHPESIEARSATAIAERSVTLSPDVDGMAWLTCHLPAVAAVAIDSRLTRIARSAQTAAEPRSRSQLRADALATLLLGPPSARSVAARPPSAGGDVEVPDERRTTDGPPDLSRPAGAQPDFSPSSGAIPDLAPTPPTPVDSVTRARPSITRDLQQFEVDDAFLPITPTVVLTVPALSLLGHDDGTAELHGFGPIDIDTARRLAARAPSFIRVLTHPETGETLSVGRTRYRPPPDMRLALLLDDESCRFPNCNRRAEACELDHTADWARGGETERANLHHLCAKHHHLKHDSSGWSVVAQAGRALDWRSPTGRHYVTLPRAPRRSSPRPSFAPTDPPDAPPRRHRDRRYACRCHRGGGQLPSRMRSPAEHP
ncbi:DUF222 domain-containing protein [Herbiconiux sp. 11R-BC]|uniref:HNH endonuclease signature motif containing protein n=1 Tax=Herbiconiux sp. 11R-BC TaxID=3111637 RepID=UPI003C09143B